MEYADFDAVRHDHTERVRQLLHHAYRKTEYYRRIFDQAGFDILKDPFHQIPLLEKDHLRKSFQELLASDAVERSYFLNRSGGSTGEPTCFAQDTAYKSWSRASEIHFDSWIGYRLGQARALLWGSERDLLQSRNGMRPRILSGIKNEIWLNAFHMSKDDMDLHVAQLIRKKPRYMLAYANSAFELARHMQAKRLRVPRMRAIMVSAGTLTEDMRELIEETFGCRVFNRYGSREVSGVACECSEQNGLHISPLTQHVEIVRKDGSLAPEGELGEIVVTPLPNFSMPLIRYRIGDMGVMASGSCRCGRKWPRLAKVIGRVADVLYTSSGGIVLPEYVIHMLGVSVKAPWMRKFQVIQYTPTKITLLIEPHDDQAGAVEPEHIKAMVHRLLLVFGTSSRIKVEVGEIPLSPSGKHRYTICSI